MENINSLLEITTILQEQAYLVAEVVLKGVVCDITTLKTLDIDKYLIIVSQELGKEDFTLEELKGIIPKLNELIIYFEK